MSKQRRFSWNMVDCNNYLVIDRKHSSSITNEVFAGASCVSAGDADVFVWELNKREEKIVLMLEALKRVGALCDNCINDEIRVEVKNAITLAQN